jgi:ubiquitin C-terminal hydrolase
MWICDECLEKYYENEKLSKQNIWECNACRKYTMCNQISLRNLIKKRNKK